MRKIKDPIVLGIVSGIIGNCAKLAGNLFNRYVLYKSETTYPEIAGGLLMSKKQRSRRIGFLVGLLADFSIGTSLGIPLVYMLMYTGKDNAAIKGFGLGNFAWISMYGFLGGGLGNKKGVFPLDAGTNTSAFINHSWYGLVTALVASKLGDPTLFPEPSNRTGEQSKSKVTNQSYFPSEKTGIIQINRLRVRPKRVI